MISTSGRKILMQFVSDVKTLLTNNIISSLQQHYGIWADGRVIPVSQLTTSNADIIYRARMLRGRLQCKRLRDSILSPFFHSYIFAMYKNEALWI